MTMTPKDRRRKYHDHSCVGIADAPFWPRKSDLEIVLDHVRLDTIALLRRRIESELESVILRRAALLIDLKHLDELEAQWRNQ